jgi:hypothetical protein
VSTENTIAQDNSGWRFNAGVALFILWIALALAIPVIAVSGMPVVRIAALTGAIVIFNKILLAAVIAVMGKPGFRQLKVRLGSYLLVPARWPSKKNGLPRK